MKKILAISAVLFLASFTQSDGQHFVASFGIQQQWGVPDYVTHTVYDRYNNYDWVHASRVYHGGGFYSFNVLLQRGNRFIELNIDDRGYSRVVNRYNYYPLAGHICGDFCGYHEYYYNSYYNICHSHNHFGHNHVTYRPRPVTYVYGHYRTYPRYVYRNNTTVIYNNPPAKSYKKTKKGTHKPQYSQQQPRRQRVDYEQRNAYQSRRTSSPAAVSVKNDYEETRRRTSVSRTENSGKASRSTGSRYKKKEEDKSAGRQGRSSTTRSSQNSRRGN